MSMNQELERICNIAGYPIYPWAAEQLKVRSDKGSLDSRNDDNLLYLANKGAWVRVVSSVNLEANLMKYFNTNLGLGINRQQDLAESYILYGGTSTYGFQSQKTNISQLGISGLETGDLIGSKTQGMNLRSGIDPNGAYNMFGQKELSDFGYRPMPGITSVTIEATGRMGSLRQATINFKVWDKYQLDVMDALYFRPGFTVLIEYGHAKYYDNQGGLQSSEQFMLNPFEGKLTKEDINIKLSTNTRKSYGNYGGMLGMVTSFNFTMTQEGGYDCTIKAMSLGAVMGNFPINHVSTLSNIYYRQLKIYLDSERSEAEKVALAEVDKIKSEAETGAQLRLNSSNDWWAKLKIDDPFKNLLFNTNSYGNLNALSSTFTGANPQLTSNSSIQFINESTVNTSGNTPVNGVINSSTIDSLTSTYESSHDLYYSQYVTYQESGITIDSTTSLLQASQVIYDKYANKFYYVEDASGKDYGDIVYFSDFKSYLVNKNDSLQQNSLVTLDVSRLNQLTGTGTFKLISGTSNNYFDFITNNINAASLAANSSKLSSNPSVYKIPNLLFRSAGYGMSYGTDIDPSIVILNDGARFSINLYYTDESKARDYFTNPNQQYEVNKIIKSSGPVLFTGKTVYLFQIVLTVPNDPDYYIVLGEPITRPARYSIADLSLIKNITHNDPFNDLTTDIALKTFQNANAEAEKQAKDERSQKEQQISNDYNTEQLKATTDSESTLELMLRSVLLFGINNVNNTTGPKYDTFIQDLFSEGAYTTMFNNGAPGKPDYSKYDQSFFEKYINGTLTPQERLDTNFRYGNNFYLMSGENAYKNDSKGSFLLKNQLRDNSCNDLTSSNTFIPQVNFDELFKIVPITYGESSDLEVNKKPQLSVFINLGLFFLMLNHTGILYNADTQQKIKNGDVITPMAYLDFNPETNFYLSSINQISIDPYKFLVSYNGTNEDYLKMFDKTLIKEKDNKFVIQATPPKSNIDDTNPLPAPESDLFNFNDDSDKLSAALPEQKKRMDGKNDGYVGKLMYIMVDINYLLDIIKNLKNNSDTNEVYFQSTIEQLLSDLNKSMGNYNAFRLSYNDSSNCFVITDDQIQSKPDSQAGNVQSEMIKDSMAFEIPIYGKRSIARAFELRTDISSRLASMLAISSNPGASNQVATAKNTSDFGVYNTGSFDRYIPMKTDTAPTAGTIVSNIPAAELATNFNNVIKSIYGVTREDSNNTTPSQGLFISKESIERARTYYIDRMAKIKNEQSGSIHAMIIPLKSNITMDGMAGLYPFQLYTIDERILPYRYSSINLSEDVNQKKVAFSIARMTHTISNNEWTTSVEGFMTLLRNPPTDQNARSLEYKPLYVDKNLVFGNAEDNTALPQNANTVYNFFIGKGLPDFIAAAFVGNFWQESRLNPNAINSSSRGRAIGIAQWLGDRKNGLLKKSNYTDLQTQLKFVWEELNSVESNAFIIIKSSTDVDQATINIRQYYERPGLSEANDANRKRIAALILKNPNTQIA